MSRTDAIVSSWMSRSSVQPFSHTHRWIRGSRRVNPAEAPRLELEFEGGELVIVGVGPPFGGRWLKVGIRLGRDLELADKLLP